MPDEPAADPPPEPPSAESSSSSCLSRCQDLLPWSLRYRGRDKEKWSDVPYDQLEREELWQESGVAMHFVTLEFDDVEMERGFQADMARRTLGSESASLVNVLRWSSSYILLFLCASLVSWVKFTLWHPSEACITRLGDRDVTFDRFLPTEPLATLVGFGGVCWLFTGYLTTRHYRWYVSNFCLVQVVFAVVATLLYFAHEYIAVTYYTAAIEWSMEEGLSFAIFQGFLAAFFSLRFVHLLYLMGWAGLVSGALRPLAYNSVVFRRQGVLGSEWSEGVLVIASLAVLCVVVYLFEKLVRKDFVLSLSLAAESELSDRLLANILPAEIIGKLKTTDAQVLDFSASIAEGYDSVSILFIEITGLSQQISDAPDDSALRILARFLALFDAIADAHGLEKIKSVGCTYMAVSGLPVRNVSHAKSALLAALEIIKNANTQVWAPPGVGFRAGLHSGAVVAGVIGRKKFSFDVWGDAVNVASRMQNLAENNTVLLTLATLALLGHQEEQDDINLTILDGVVLLQNRGQRPVKGKGLMLTYTARYQNYEQIPSPQGSTKSQLLKTSYSTSLASPASSSSSSAFSGTL